MEIHIMIECNIKPTRGYIRHKLKKYDEKFKQTVI